MHRRHRRRSGLALSGGALVAGGVTAAVLVLGGPGTANTFAAWTPSPTTPAPGQVATAEAACEAGAAAPATGRPARIGHGRDPCVARRQPRALHVGALRGEHLHARGSHVRERPVDQPELGYELAYGQSIGGQPALPAAAQITLDRLQAETADNGQAYTIAEGSVGTGVTAAKLTLGDGSHVVTTTGNGLFLAWWPGSAVVTSATLTTATGTTSQAINSPTLDTGSSSNG